MKMSLCPRVVFNEEAGGRRLLAGKMKKRNWDKEQGTGEKVSPFPPAPCSLASFHVPPPKTSTFANTQTGEPCPTQIA